MTKDKQLYDILGLPSSSTPTEIASAYRRLALLYHPDRQQTITSNEDFGRIQYAYQILSDESSRHLYDKYGRIGLAIMQQTGSAETAESLLNPFRSVLVLFTIVFVIFVIMSTPVLFQCKSDGWINWSWWSVMSPALTILGLLFIMISFGLGSAIYTQFSKKQTIEDERTTAPEPLESKWSFILPIAIAWLAIVTAITQIVSYTLYLSDAVSWQEWEVFQPWAAFESVYLIYKGLEGFTVWRRYMGGEEPRQFIEVYHLFKWSVVRIAFVSALALYPEIISVHIFMLPLYLVVVVLGISWYLSKRSWLVALPIIYPLTSFALLHLRLATKTIRWFTVFFPTYAIVGLVVLLFLLAIPSVVIWHRGLFESDSDDFRPEEKLKKYGYALAPGYQKRIASATNLSIKRQ